MRPLLIAICVVMLGAIPAFGQLTGGYIGLYSDNPGFTECYLTEALYTTNSIFVVHDGITEGNTAQFAISHNWTAVQGSVNYFGNLNLGEPYTGVTITYVGCKPLPHLLCQLDWIPTAVTAPCTVFFEVIPDPVLASGQIEIVDCGSNVRFAQASKLGVNGDAGTPGCECGLIDATEPATWGKIKSLYQ